MPCMAGEAERSQGSRLLVLSDTTTSSSLHLSANDAKNSSAQCYILRGAYWRNAPRRAAYPSP
jgi:hypothetical protein